MVSVYTKQAEEEIASSSPDDMDADEWDKRINNTGCYKENLALQLCHAETNDWRQCTEEMMQFKECWSKFNNDKRTHSVDM